MTEGSEVELADDNVRRQLVQAIHDSPTMLVLAVAGGGNAVITDLLDVPGASRTVLEMRVPYAATAMADLLALDDDEPWGDSEPEVGAVSTSTAQTMAEACLERAHQLSPDHHDVIGVACTAALVTDRTKKGDHRAHIAIARGSSRHHNGPPMEVVQQKIELEKGQRDRTGEDRVVADAILSQIAAAITPT
ncbi:MAG: nicotinamide mononucleotide (NMN) deamidase PncC [Acidimicrobiales bacterium]